jgi:hypothetical protein
LRFSGFLPEREQAVEDRQNKKEKQARHGKTADSRSQRKQPKDPRVHDKDRIIFNNGNEEKNPNEVEVLFEGPLLIGAQTSLKRGFIFPPVATEGDPRPTLRS